MCRGTASFPRLGFRCADSQIPASSSSSSSHSFTHFLSSLSLPFPSLFLPFLSPFPLSPSLTHSKHQLDLPTTPLGIPSSATFCVINHGYGDLELKHRISPTIPIELLVTYPDGPDIGGLINLLPGPVYIFYSIFANRFEKMSICLFHSLFHPVDADFFHCFSL
jgi:hypothetical protein